jgi:hypothetical protein
MKTLAQPSAFNMTATHDGGFLLVGGIFGHADPSLPDAYVVRLNSNGDTYGQKELVAVTEIFC